MTHKIIFIRYLIFICCLIIFLTRGDVTECYRHMVNPADRVELASHVDIYSKYNVITPSEIVRLIVVYPSNYILLNANKKMYILTANINNENAPGCFFMNIYRSDDFVQLTCTYESLLHDLKVFKKRIYISAELSYKLFDTIQLLQEHSMVYVDR